MSVKMSEMQKSALLEAGNIGSGHAAIALSQLMGRKIMIAIPSIDILQLSQLNTVLDGKGKDFVLVDLQVLGDATGAMLFTLDKEKATSLCDIVMGQSKGATKILNELEQSALKEIGSIIGASYLNAISEMANMSLLVSTPEYHSGKIDILGKVVQAKDVEIKDVSEVLCIRTEFIEAATRIEGYLIFVPASNAIAKIMGSLGV